MNSKLNCQLIAVADKVRDTKKHPEIAEVDEAFTDALGAKLACILYLRRDPDHRDRWKTTEGTKTNRGLARTILRILEEANP